PPEEGDVIESGVSDVDADGNEVDGMRLPDVSVPLATHTGWNPVDSTTGFPGQPVDMLGSTIPFPRTAADRDIVGDPRPSIAERYAGLEDYLSQVRGAVDGLVAARLVLDEDVDLVMQTAARAWRLFTRPG